MGVAVLLRGKRKESTGIATQERGQPPALYGDPIDEEARQKRRYDEESYMELVY
jgi:hypothetical protein